MQRETRGKPSIDDEILKSAHLQASRHAISYLRNGATQRIMMMYVLIPIATDEMNRLFNGYDQENREKRRSEERERMDGLLTAVCSVGRYYHYLNIHKILIDRCMKESFVKNTISS